MKVVAKTCARNIPVGSVSGDTKSKINVPACSVRMGQYRLL